MSVHLAKAEGSKDTSYFSENDTISLYTDAFSGLEMLEDVTADHKVFITGENHTYTESNARLWLKMIKFLHKKANVRNVMFEYGFSYGWLVNEYIHTGDTVLYNSIKHFAYKEYSEAIKELYEFNQTLDSSERIYLCAIDIERGVYPVAKLLDYLIPQEYEAHDSIEIHLQSLHSLARYNDEKLHEQGEENMRFTNFTYKSNPTIELVRDNFSRWEEEYKSVLGDRFELFKEVLTERFEARNRWYGYENDGAIQQYIYRENYMHAQFLEQYDKREGNWFGQFGRCHTTKTRQNANSCEWYMFNSLANRIKHTKGGAFSDSVLTIGIMYEMDREMGPERTEFESSFDTYFEDVPDSGIVLFNVRSDSLIDSVYGQDFDYMFLSRHNQRGEVYEAMYELYDRTDLGVKVKLSAELGMPSIGLRSLDNVYDDAGFDGGFANNLYAIGMRVIVGGMDELPFFVGYSFGLYNKIEREHIDGELTSLAGFYIKEEFLYDLLRSDVFDLYLGGGLGYEQLRLTSRRSTSVDNQVEDGFLGSSRASRFTNPAWIIELIAAPEINIGPFFIGAEYSYRFDLSSKEWRTGGELINDSPRTNFGGSYQEFKLGLVF